MSCSALFCSSKSKLRAAKNPEVSFHTFPKSPEVRNAWIKAINRENWEPRNYSRLCSKHFEPSCYIPDYRARIKQQQADLQSNRTKEDVSSLFKMPPVLSKRQKMGFLLILSAAAAEERKKNRKRFWMKKIYHKRGEYTHMNNIMNDLNVIDFHTYLRMNSEILEMLLSRVGPEIQRRDTIMRDSVSAKERLLITLRYLATGESYPELMVSYAVSPQLMSIIIPETCLAIYKSLKDEFLKLPYSTEEWKQIAEEFQNKWQFPNCVGAMDGKHICITKPNSSGSVYYNYKKYFSVVLFAVVDAKYEFIYVHAGINGRAPDSGVLKRTKFYEKLINESLNLPEQSILPRSQVTAPYLFIGDSGFPLLQNLLVPYPYKDNDYSKKVYNYRLSRARRVTENAFGILATRFRLFYKPITLHVDYLDYVILACCTLHNFLSKMCKESDIPESLLDREDMTTGNRILGDYRQYYQFLDVEEKLAFSNEEGQVIREGYRRYFCNEGKVDFQDRMIV